MIKLTGDKIAVEPIFDPDKIGSLFVPEQAKERADQGIIKYIGPDVKDLKVGDYILFSGYTGTMVRLSDEGLLIIFPEKFATCLVEPPDTDVPGLYFRDKEGQYFTATYEQIFYLVSKAFQNEEWRKGLSPLHRKAEGKRVHEPVEPADHEEWR